jgi:hypothetical protein
LEVEFINIAKIESVSLEPIKILECLDEDYGKLLKDNILIFYDALFPDHRAKKRGSLSFLDTGFLRALAI